jgi:hypothetical protein
MTSPITDDDDFKYVEVAVSFDLINGLIHPGCYLALPSLFGSARIKRTLSHLRGS